MTHTATIVYTRPNTNVEWFPHHRSGIDYVSTTYAGKRLSVTETESINGLTKTRVMIWTSIEDFEIYKQDPKVLILLSQLDAYCLANNITIVWST
jgi:hypothetical protein